MSVKTLNQMQRTSIINSLIVNCSCWDKGDKDYLMKVSDAKLVGLARNAELAAIGAKHKPATTSTSSNPNSQIGIIANAKNADDGGLGEIVKWVNTAPDAIKAKMIAKIKEAIGMDEPDPAADPGADPAAPTAAAEGQPPVDPAANETDGRLDNYDVMDPESTYPATTNDGDDSGGSIPVKPAAATNRRPAPGGKGRTVNATQQWINSAPAEVRPALQGLLANAGREKAELVRQLTANTADPRQRAALAAKLQVRPVDVLRDMAALVGNAGGHGQPTIYAGANGGDSHTQNRGGSANPDDDAPLIPPVINWKEPLAG